MRPLVPILGLLLLAACAGQRPTAPPQAEVTPPPSWHTDPGVPAGEIDATWWQSFNNPALTQVVVDALEHNLDLAIAITRIAQARAQFHLAQAQRLPDVVGDAGGRRDRDLNPGFGIPERQTAGEGDITISYDLDLFGRLTEASEAARALWLSSEAARDTVRLAVAASAAGGYISLCALRDRFAVLQSTLEARADSLKVARQRARAGYSSQLDLAQADADYRDTEQLIPAAQLAISQQEDGLSLLLGDNPREIACDGGLHTITLPAVPGAVPASLMRHRPDIMAAEQQLVAADHSLDSARAAFMPDIQISASGGEVASNIIESPVALWSLGGSALAPIFDSGRLQAQQDAAAAARDSSAFAYRKAALTAFREVEDALATMRRSGERDNALRAERDILAKTLALATNRYRSGYSPYLDQLDAQRGLLTVDLALVQARTDRLSAAINLYQALGGGWQEAATP
ncbi:MAG: efflux transporter outer membrane subunit [Aliidongia sp.]